MKWSLAAPVLAALLLSACTTQEKPSAVETLGVKAAIDSLWAEYAYASDRKDAAAFGKLFTEGAVLDFSTAPTQRGRDSIQTFLARLYADLDPTGMRVEADETKVDGSLAVQSGTFQERYTEKGSENTKYGRFALVAELQADRSWKIQRLVAITDSTVADR